MKTIKFLHYAKYPVLILIALVGIFIGGTQNPPPKPMANSIATDIGGQATPRSGGVLPVGQFKLERPSFVCYRFADDIGGNGNAQPKPSGPPFGISDIGGQRVPGTTIPLGVTEIGGNNQNKPQEPNPLGYRNMTIGGKGTPKSLADIGGNQGIPKPPLSDIGGGQLPPRPFFEIGGQQAPRNPSVLGMIGNITNIGGNQGVPRNPLQILSVYDFGDQDVFIDDVNIGGNSAPKNLLDIGGGQTAPRTITEIGEPVSPLKDINPIGGGQTAPRTVADICGNQSKPNPLLNDIGGGQTPPRQ